MTFVEFYDKVVKVEDRFEGTLLSLDPGETTGFSVFTCYPPKMTHQGQIICSPLEKGIDEIGRLILEHKPTFLVYENYLVYSWKSQDHSWAALHTPNLIGCIQMHCHQQKIRKATQMAQHPKQFVTDDKLREWGYYIKGKKHARDALRHACFFLLFTFPKHKIAP